MRPDPHRESEWLLKQTGAIWRLTRAHCHDAPCNDSVRLESCNSTRRACLFNNNNNNINLTFIMRLKLAMQTQRRWSLHIGKMQDQHL